MLNSMQILPVANISQITLLDNLIVGNTASSLKDKRKETESDHERPTKKKGETKKKPTHTSKRKIANGEDVTMLGEFFGSL